MKRLVNKFILSFSCILLLLPIATNAQSSYSYIKYKDYLIPVKKYIPPVVETLGVTNVKQTSAVVNMEIKEGNNIYSWFEFSVGAQAPTCSEIAPSDAVLKQAGQRHAFTFQNLEPDTQYSYRACGKDDPRGTLSSGASFSFRTDPIPVDPVFIDVYSERNRTADGAKLRGRVTSGENVITWFQLGSRFCSNSAKKYGQQTLSADTISSYTITGLNEWTTYSYRFCAINEDGRVVDGGLEYFTTKRSERQREVACGTTYYSEDGPVNVYVNVREHLFYDHAVIRFNNDSTSSTSYYYQGRVARGNRSVNGRSSNRLLLDPGFNNGRYYIVKKFDDSGNWDVTFGCMSEDIYRSAAEGDTDETE